ncbi:MAG TPA: tetratricopeptide repeat protein [Acidobacteriaceae bacterium]|nr:tetratricopeptide repeat protein [Acidobacteriaceae bacterium]
MRILYSRTLFYLLLAVLCVSPALAVHAASIPASALQPVSADLTTGKADDAISRLSSSLATNPGDAEAHHLLCRVYYQEERWDDAIHECEIAVRLMPLDSDYHLWLGRAYGEKADKIHSIKAYGLAKKVRDEFERAVQLEGGNVDALSDLGEFYTAAPGIVGGGKKKAQGVAQALEQYGPAQAHELKGRLAEKDKNYTLAEAEFRAAVEASDQPADAWMTLASYYARHRQWDQMLEALHAGIDADAKAAKPHGPALVDGAGILSRTNQEPQLAIELLKLYLASPNQSADSPAFQVHSQLSRLLEQQGDYDGARQQIEAAAALARAYHPAPPRSGSQ